MDTVNTAVVDTVDFGDDSAMRADLANLEYQIGIERVGRVGRVERGDKRDQ